MSQCDLTELIGAAPCDTCRHAARCGVTGEACLSFHSYVKHQREGVWSLQPKQPRRDIGKRLGFEQRELPEPPVPVEPDAAMLELFSRLP